MEDTKASCLGPLEKQGTHLTCFHQPPGAARLTVDLFFLFLFF